MRIENWVLWRWLCFKKTQIMSAKSSYWKQNHRYYKVYLKTLMFWAPLLVANLPDPPNAIKKVLNFAPSGRVFHLKNGHGSLKIFHLIWLLLEQCFNTRHRMILFDIVLITWWEKQEGECAYYTKGEKEEGYFWSKWNRNIAI